MSTNLTTATIVIVAATNWFSRGTFYDKLDGRTYDVQQAYLQTNTIGRMQAEGQTLEHTFKSINGPTNPAGRLVLTATQSTDRTPPMPIIFDLPFSTKQTK